MNNKVTQNEQCTSYKTMRSRMSMLTMLSLLGAEFVAAVVFELFFV